MLGYMVQASCIWKLSKGDFELMLWDRAMETLGQPMRIIGYM